MLVFNQQQYRQAFEQVFIRMRADNKDIKCPDCKQKISKQDLKSHVIMCKSYVAKLLPNTIKMSEYLTKDYLQFLIAELDIAKQRISSKLEQSEDQMVNFASYQTVKLQDQKLQPPQKQMQIKENGKTPHETQTKGKPDEQQQKLHRKSFKQKKKQQQQTIKQQTNKQEYKQLVSCCNCAREMDSNDVSLFSYNYNCLHLLCIDCIKSYVGDQYVKQKGSLVCLVKGCKSQLASEQVRQILGAEQFDKLQTQLLRGTISFTRCCRCKHQYEFSEGNAKDAPKTDQSGKKITKALGEHYAKNRFVCPNPVCKQQQCRLCQSTPYHLGKTCTQNQQFKNSKKCRYCRQPLKSGYTSNIGIPAFHDICPKKQCEKTARNACSKIHPCKHPCYGYIREKKCLPCLDENCSKKQVKHDQNQDSYCSICYIEDLKASPCVMSKCGHIFHYACMQKRLQIRWLTPRILFGFCHCPLCKQWIQLPDDCPLTEVLNKNKQLYKSLQDKAFNRLKFQKLEKDPKITDSKSNYYEKPIDYAMAIYAYFQCFKCKKPYFGGRKSCAQMMNQQSSTGAHSQFDASKLVCPQCCPIQVKNCSKHGKQFIAFKCKFCCNIGLWFCWGSTHFCDDCHKRQQKGEYISKIPKQKLPKCQGQQKCPSGGNHGQNGNQFSLGCLLCRNYKQQAQKF